MNCRQPTDAGLDGQPWLQAAERPEKPRPDAGVELDPTGPRGLGP